jgi:DNA-binding response OmpR family regulator
MGSGPNMQRILIVDDEPAILLAMSSYLENRDYTVDTAEDLSMAEELLSENDFDVVVTDLRLSARRTEGLDILRFIRERRMRARTVLLTAYGSTAVEAEAKALSVDRYLQKPIELAELSQVISSLLHMPRKESTA